jgi:hypothetical protein
MTRRWPIRLAAAATALAAVIVITAPAAMGSSDGHGVVVTSNRIGPLRLDVSGPRAVLNFAGFPQAGGPHSLQYDCFRRNRQLLCRINYFFGTTGRFKNRLIAAVISAGPFHSRNGTSIGMSASQARSRERRALPTDFCGNNVLRYPPPTSTSTAPLAGLDIGFANGKVAGFIVLSPHARISCFAGGGFSILG